MKACVYSFIPYKIFECQKNPLSIFSNFQQFPDLGHNTQKNKIRRLLCAGSHIQSQRFCKISSSPD